MERRGFILPFSIILALVVLTSLGLWYRQVVLQGYLAERLLLQRSFYIECRSLMPVLLEKMDHLDPSTLEMDETEFMTVEVNQHLRWQIGRSALSNGRVRFDFRRAGRNDEPLVLTTPYERKSGSGFPPDFATE